MKRLIINQTLVLLGALTLGLLVSQADAAEPLKCKSEAKKAAHKAANKRYSSDEPRTTEGISLFQFPGEPENQ